MHLSHLQSIILILSIVCTITFANPVPQSGDRIIRRSSSQIWHEDEPKTRFLSTDFKSSPQKDGTLFSPEDVFQPVSLHTGDDYAELANCASDVEHSADAGALIFARETGPLCKDGKISACCGRDLDMGGKVMGDCVHRKFAVSILFFWLASVIDVFL